jgi:UDP-N-acetylmuramoyl-tripeptide--D-alanyl-D-alanine ligase
MESLKISEINNILHGELINFKEDFYFSNIALKSWKVKPGDLYIALVDKSDNFYQPIEKAVKSGAAAVITPQEVAFDIPQIVVNDTWNALSAISKYYKDKFNLPTIVITGSTGKTTTKDIVASVLGEEFTVHKTQQNNNSTLGVPYTIFHMKYSHKVSVLEAGIDQFGNISRSVEIIRPSIAIITNIGTAHLEKLKTKENILRLKMEVTEYFHEDSTLIINADDEFLSTIKDKPYKIVKISTQGKGDYNAFDIVDLGEAGVQFKCKYREKTLLLRLNVVGRHNVYNALASIAVADLFNLDGEQVRLGLVKFKPSDLRMDIRRLEDNIRLFVDCYNANPDSMKAALDSLKSFGKGRKIAVLGDMFELGHYSEEAHREIGKYCRNRCDLLLAVGSDSKYIYEEAQPYVTSRYFTSKQQALEFLKDSMLQDDIILIKGSRGMEMERIADALYSEV